MKKIYLLGVLILGSFTLSAQKVEFPIDPATSKVTFTEVVEVEGTKDQLYDKALEWFAMTFKSSNDVLQIKDKEAGKLIATYNAYSSNLGAVSANITILLKDKKYKYVITDIIYGGTSAYKAWRFEEDPSAFKVNMMKYAINGIKRDTKSTIESTILSLKESMNKPSVSTDF